jgi:hypothetical protein
LIKERKYSIYGIRVVVVAAVAVNANLKTLAVMKPAAKR